MSPVGSFTLTKNVTLPVTRSGKAWPNTIGSDGFVRSTASGWTGS